MLQQGPFRQWLNLATASMQQGMTNDKLLYRPERCRYVMRILPPDDETPNPRLDRLASRLVFDAHEGTLGLTSLDWAMVTPLADGQPMLEGAELLDAIQHMVTLAFSHDSHEGKRFVCDADNYRATREAELKVMARHAAEQVRKTNTAFTFGPMNAVERRVIHLTLADERDILTESVGEGSARRLKVAPKK